MVTYHWQCQVHQYIMPTSSIHPTYQLYYVSTYGLIFIRHIIDDVLSRLRILIPQEESHSVVLTTIIKLVQQQVVAIHQTIHIQNDGRYSLSTL